MSWLLLLLLLWLVVVVVMVQLLQLLQWLQLLVNVSSRLIPRHGTVTGGHRDRVAH